MMKTIPPPQGKKSVFKMEAVEGEYVRGLRVYRLYGKCAECRAAFTIKTDPENDGYVLESGGRRRYEHAADSAAVKEAEDAEEDEAKDDAMRALQLAAEDAERDMKMADALEETLAINRRMQDREDLTMAALDFLYYSKTEAGRVAGRRGGKGSSSVAGTAGGSSEAFGGSERDDLEDEEEDLAEYARMLKEFEKERMAGALKVDVEELDELGFATGGVGGGAPGAASSSVGVVSDDILGGSHGRAAEGAGKTGKTTSGPERAKKPGRRRRSGEVGDVFGEAKGTLAVEAKTGGGKQEELQREPKRPKVEFARKDAVAPPPPPSSEKAENEEKRTGLVGYSDSDDSSG